MFQQIPADASFDDGRTRRPMVTKRRRRGSLTHPRSLLQAIIVSEAHTQSPLSAFTQSLKLTGADPALGLRRKHLLSQTDLFG